MMRSFSPIGQKYAAVLAFFLVMAGVHPANAAMQKPQTTRLIVKMAKGLTQAQAQSVLKGHGGTSKAAISKLDVHIVEVPAQAADAIMKRMKDDAQIQRSSRSHPEVARRAIGPALSESVGSAEDLLGPGLRR